MFYGTHKFGIDGKGHLAILAKFREVLQREFVGKDGETCFVVTLDSRDRLLFYPECEWGHVEQQLLRLNV